MSNKKDKTFLKGINYGLTATALMGAYSICVSAALGRGVVFALVCTVICALFSLKGNGNIFAPASLLLLPIFVFSQDMPIFYCGFAILGGSLICLLLNTIFKSKDIPDCVIAGGAIGLAIGVTIMLTNVYFGIGSFGGTALEMLKNYRYLGFHPDFRGLLYGTITLFTMITYPFKFRKLNKYLPAEFITVLLPFIINLLLNPDKSTSTTNEYTFASSNAVLNSDYSSIPNLTDILGVSLAYGIIFYGISQARDKLFPSVNLTTGLLSGSAVAPYSVRGYTKASAVTVIAVSTVVILCCPSLIARLPLPCVGSMLIVSAWQHIPFKKISGVIGEKSIIKILALILCAVSFVIFSTPVATFICAVVAVIISKLSSIKRKEEAV